MNEPNGESAGGESAVVRTPMVRQLVTSIPTLNLSVLFSSQTAPMWLIYLFANFNDTRGRWFKIGPLPDLGNYTTYDQNLGGNGKYW